MAVKLRYLPTAPTQPIDNSIHHKFGTPEYDKARQEFARDLRYYRNQLRSYTKKCIEFYEGTTNAAE